MKRGLATSIAMEVTMSESVKELSGATFEAAIRSMEVREPVEVGR